MIPALKVLSQEDFGLSIAARVSLARYWTAKKFPCLLSKSSLENMLSPFVSSLVSSFLMRSKLLVMDCLAIRLIRAWTGHWVAGHPHAPRRPLERPSLTRSGAPGNSLRSDNRSAYPRSSALLEMRAKLRFEDAHATIFACATGVLGLLESRSFLHQKR